MVTRYTHVHLPFYSSLIGSFDSLDLRIHVFVCYLTDQVFGEDHTSYEELEFP